MSPIEVECKHCKKLIWNNPELFENICIDCAKKDFKPKDNDFIFCEDCGKKVQYGKCYGLKCSFCFWKLVIF